MSNLGPNYPGYPGQGSMNSQHPPSSPFQQPKASPSHPSQLSVRSSPSHPSQLQSIRSSPSHPSQLQSVRSSPSHPSQLQNVRNSPSHPSQLQTIRSSPSHPSQMQLPVGAVGSSSQGTSHPSHQESEDQTKLRFQVEMEFVQSLGNPNYLHFLAQRGYMKDPCFVNYIKYLQYWQEPQYVNSIQTKQFVESRTQLKVKLSLKLRNPRNELLKPFNKGKSASMDPTRFPPGMYGEDVHGVGMDLSGGFLGTRTDSSRDYSFLRFNQPINEPCNVYKNADISSDAVETKPDVGSIGDNSSKDESDLWSKMQTEESNKTSSVENTVTENGAKGSPLIGSIAPEEQEKDIILTKEGPDTKPDMKACDTKDGIKNTGEHPTDMGDFVKVETSEIHYCRFCAAPASSCIDIFETEGQALNLYDKITKCLRLYLSADDQLPNTLCYPCLEKIEFVFSFSEQVYHSHRALIQHLDICQTSSTNFDQVLHSYFEDSNFFSFNTRLMKCEKDWEPNSEEETLPEEQEEAPKNRGKKKKKLNLKNKKKNSQTVGSKKLWKKERMKVKLRFTPSLTTCASCGHKSDTSKENLEHWDQEHKDKNIEYRCFETGCEFRINCVMTMKQHTKEHMFKEGKLTQCEICAKYFAKRQIKAHLAIHSDVCQYSCNKCGKMFKVRSAMITHEKTHDPEYASNSYCCPECGKEYNMKHQFDAHVRRHSEIRPYRCEICSKAFWSPNDLQYHMSIHTGLRPYPCSQCDLKFARPLDVKKHFITRHSEPTKFACSYCPVKYNRRDQLKVHELSHTGETPFKCEICGKGFTRKDKLVRHSDVHVTDDSKYRYSCHLCEKRYTQSGSLFTHMKNSHGV